MVQEARLKLEGPVTEADRHPGGAGLSLAARPCPVADLCRFLQGAWRLHRRGWNAGPVPSMRLRGTARFLPSARGLLFEESGTMVLGAYRGEAMRRYEFALRGESAADVFFDDGRPFHHLDLTTGAATVEHLCGADLYRGAYHVFGPDRWMQRWTVTGPRKRQHLMSLFTRLCGD